VHLIPPKGLIMIPLLLVLAMFSGFTQKWFIPQGINYGAGRICIGDADQDGSCEFYIRTYGGSQKVYIHELHLPNVWEVDSFPYFWGPLIWDFGDFDLDGKYDLAIQTAVDTPPQNLISIAESPDSFSYPTTEVWRDTVGFPLVIPICVFDVDQDGKPEIVDGNGDGATDFNIFESTGDNLYELIFTGNPPHSASSTFAFGDFDNDLANEFVFGDLSGRYMIYECNGDNSYAYVLDMPLSTLNIKDCCTIPDADQDGEWEFVVKGFVIPTAEIHAFIFEATGDNTYEVIQTFTLPGGDYDGGYSEAGDVDGDSIPEIVLEARYNVFIIKAAGDNAFYVWDTLPGFSGGSSIRVTEDIDNNGLNEIVVSGNNYTRIYEYDGGGMEERTAYGVKHNEIQITPNPFSKLTTISFGTVQGAKGVELKVHDATGRLVKSFSLPTAYSLLPTITWDGTDDVGQPLSSGVYFLHLETQNSKIVEKIVLLR
jgi:hypothetical protein